MAGMKIVEAVIKTLKVELTLASDKRPREIPGAAIVARSLAQIAHRLAGRGPGQEGKLPAAMGSPGEFGNGPIGDGTRLQPGASHESAAL